MMATETERRILERVETLLKEMRKEMPTKADVAELRQHLEGKINDVRDDVQWIREQYPV